MVKFEAIKLFKDVPSAIGRQKISILSYICCAFEPILIKLITNATNVE